MAKHTEGPWSMSEPDHFGDIAITGPADALAIAAVCNGEMRRLTGQEEEHIANARLIAAAPCMLAELRYLDRAATMSDEDRATLRKLIADAEGRGGDS